MKEGEAWQLKKFEFGPILISYPRVYYQFIKECFLFDMYRTDLINKGDVVIDLGAAVGEFTILASKKVGDSGLIIAVEPNPQDFELLKENVTRNECHNVILLNKGVGAVAAEKESSFWGRKFKMQLDTLDNLMHQVELDRGINFVKMDIEGFETDVISNSIEIIKNANVISIELHNSKNEIDNILALYGFDFEPVTANYCIRKLLRNTAVFHPWHFLRAVLDTIANNPRLLYKLFIGYEMGENATDLTKPHLLMGTYIHKDSKIRS